MCVAAAAGERDMRTMAHITSHCTHSRQAQQVMYAVCAAPCLVVVRCSGAVQCLMIGLHASHHFLSFIRSSKIMTSLFQLSPVRCIAQLEGSIFVSCVHDNYNGVLHCVPCMLALRGLCTVGASGGWLYYLWQSYAICLFPCVA